MFKNLDELTDKSALDWIADILRKEEWGPEEIEMIIRIVEFTGRDTSPLEDIGDEDEE